MIRVFTKIVVFLLIALGGTILADFSYIELHDLRIGENKKRVFKKYGKPTDIKMLPGGGMLYSFWVDKEKKAYITIEVYPQDTSSIWAIQITGKEGVQLKGFSSIHLGTQEDSVYLMLGNPSSVKELVDVSSKLLLFDNSNVSVGINQNRVNSIRIVSPVKDLSLLKDTKNGVYVKIEESSDDPIEVVDIMQKIVDETFAMGKMKKDQYAIFENCVPRSIEEYFKFDKNSVLLIAAISRNKRELPISKVYFKQGEQTIKANKVFSTVSKVQNKEIANAFGNFREIAVCLVPLKYQNLPYDLFVNWNNEKTPLKIGVLDPSEEEILPLFAKDPSWNEHMGTVNHAAVKAFIYKKFELIVE